jgi:hypothetical protein
MNSDLLKSRGPDSGIGGGFIEAPQKFGERRRVEQHVRLSSNFGEGMTRPGGFYVDHILPRLPRWRQIFLTPSGDDSQAAGR